MMYYCVEMIKSLHHGDIHVTFTPTSEYAGTRYHAEIRRKSSRRRRRLLHDKTADGPIDVWIWNDWRARRCFLSAPMLTWAAWKLRLFLRISMESIFKHRKDKPKKKKRFYNESQFHLLIWRCCGCGLVLNSSDSPFPHSNLFPNVTCSQQKSRVKTQHGYACMWRSRIHSDNNSTLSFKLKVQVLDV